MFVYCLEMDLDFSKFIKNPFMDVTNLFSKGDRVPWPGDNIPGFLSYKHCPNLWNLGVHSDIDSERGIAITEDIISCANMQNENHKTQTTTSKIYLRAYKELVQFSRWWLDCNVRKKKDMLFYGLTLSGYDRNV